MLRLHPSPLCYPFPKHSYLGELVKSLGADITLDDVLAILDEHYNNVKALDALKQELFQLQMGEKETVFEGGSSVKAPPSSGGIIPRTFSARPHHQAEAGLLLWRAA